MTDKQKLTIGQKICAAMAHHSVISCPKAGYMQSQNYYYFKADDVVNAASKAFCEIGIIMIIEDVEYEHIVYDKQTRSDTKTTSHYFIIKGKATFINCDNLDDKISIFFLGSAEDGSDKAIGKANTYAKKIALMNILMIQDGEDADSVATEESRVEQVQKKSFSSNPSPTTPKQDSIQFLVETENAEIQEKIRADFFKQGSTPNRFFKSCKPEWAAKTEKLLNSLGLEKNNDGVYTIKGY